MVDYKIGHEKLLTMGYEVYVENEGLCVILFGLKSLTFVTGWLSTMTSLQE